MTSTRFEPAGSSSGRRLFLRTNSSAYSTAYTGVLIIP